MELGERYLRGRERVVALVSDLGGHGWARPVPACPGWSVHDVVAHLVGVTDDAIAGNMEGAPGPAWTAAQVAKRRGVDGPSLLTEWDANAQPFAEALTALAIVPGVIDVLTHEQDLRSALGVPGGDADDLTWVTLALEDRLAGRISEAGLPSLTLTTERGTRILGEGESGVSLRTTDLELFRASLGRRSIGQVSAMGWEGDPDPYIEHLSVFDPHPVDLLE